MKYYKMTSRERSPPSFSRKWGMKLPVTLIKLGGNSSEKWGGLSHVTSNPATHFPAPLLHCHRSTLLSFVVPGFELGISYARQILHLCKAVSQALNLDSPVPDSWHYRPLPCNSCSFHNRWDILNDFDFTLFFCFRRLSEFLQVFFLT